MQYETISEAPFYRVVDGVVKGEDGNLPKGYQLPYTENEIIQNNKTYTVFGALPGSVKPQNAVETRLLKVVDTTPPPPAGTRPVRTVIELDDGTTWEAVDFREV